MEIQKKVNLRKYSTYRTGGEADFLYECNSADELKESIVHAKANELEFVVIGSGSNVLFSDEGFRGLVIVNCTNGIKFWENNVKVDSGFSLAKLINQAASKGFAGLESLVGIPGTTGGAVYGNAGAYGCEILDYVEEITVFSNGEEVVISAGDIESGYRYSMFQDTGDVILDITFNFIEDEIGEIQNRIQKTLKKRNNPKGFTCGSFFKNPENISAGQLIDEAGLKGKKVGGAMVSSDHANFIINTGDATSKDIFDLSESIKKEVFSNSGIELTREVKMIGKF